ncbi:MAG: hypothetical protein ACREYC_27035, partial [Gammaproteobacteria bacterium]
MRTIFILTVLAITTAVLAYSFIREDTVAEQPQAVTSQTGATSAVGVQDRLDELASALRHYQQTNQEQLQQANLQQTRLNRMLAELDSRLRSVETGAGEQTTHAVVSDSVEQATDTAVPNSGAGKPGSGTDLGHWMDEKLRVGNSDRDSTALAIAQVDKSIAKLPGVNLEDMQCSERLCRATFAHE